MKKKVITISIVSIIVVGILLGILIPICLNLFKDDSAFNPKLDEFVMSVEDASSLGISKGGAIANTVNAGPHSTAVSDKKDNKNYIVKMKEGDSHLYKVNFKNKDGNASKYQDNTNKEFSQDDIDAEIDKLYVLGDYTFMSFVREGESERPAYDPLLYDYDNVCVYDKCYYYTDDDRKSYIIDNNSGLIYPIEGINIRMILGGLLFSADTKLVYDFKVNDNDELEIYALYTNSSIICHSAFKDKYGRKYIYNDTFDTYDSSTNTYYYKPSSYTGIGDSTVYRLTSTNETVKVTYTFKDYSPIIKSVEMVLEDGTTRALTSSDNFDIYNTDKNLVGCTYGSLNIRVKDGKVYCHLGDLGVAYAQGLGAGYPEHYYNTADDFGYSLDISITNLTDSNKIRVFSEANSVYYDNSLVYNLCYLKQYDIVLEYRDGAVYYYKDVMKNMAELVYDGSKYDSDYDACVYEIDSLADLGAKFVATKLLECPLNRSEMTYWKYKPMYYTINGVTYYDIVVEDNGTDIEVKAVPIGSYVPSVTFVFQPINK